MRGKSAGFMKNFWDLCSRGEMDGRIETGYRITENGPVALSPEMDRLFATEIK